ncbi:MAG: glycosyltransferase family 4 protein [Chloroflexi bacterium]|nr:glycosyltransferase family 4 protein [Chloroflexota bacterium]
MTEALSPTPRRTRVLLISPDVVGPRMAGSGIRAWNLARVLAPSCDVLLAAPTSGAVATPGFRLLSVTLDAPAEIDEALAWAEVVVSNGNLLHDYPQLTDLSVPWVVDAYVPTPTEALAANQHRDQAERLAGHAVDTRAVNRFLARADLVLCASERQRDLYLGLLAALGRLNPLNYDADPSLRALVDVVPYGLPAEPPVHTRAVLKGAEPGIRPEDKVLLWGGGIWNWFDPLTLIEAVALVAAQRDDVRLCFPGARHPYVERVPDMEMRARAAALADSLGLTDRHVFFREWTAYEDRPNYLLEADLGVSMHPAGLEARFSYRTRMLDYLWAGLPMVVSDGDLFADLVRAHGLGRVVAPGDVQGLATAILGLLAEPDARGSRAEAFRRVAAGMSWEVVARPLIAFCQRPHLAPDRQAGYTSGDPYEVATLRRDAEEARQRIEALEALVAGYQNGRLMRALAALQGWRQRLPWRKKT